MAHTQSLSRRALAVMLSILMAFSFGVGYAVTASTSTAYADETSEETQTSNDLADLTYSDPETQTNFSGVVEVNGQNTVPSAEAYSSSIRTSAGRLTAGKDYTVSYDWSDVNSEGVGTVTATLTGIGDYTGTKTIKLTIEAYTLTISGLGDTKTLSANELRDLAASSTDNTEPAKYQFGTTVIVVPAKQYITYNTLIENEGGGASSNDLSAAFAAVTATAGTGDNTFSATYTLRQAYDGKWYPAQTADSYSTEGAESTPAVLGLEYAKAEITTTAGAAATDLISRIDANTADLDQTPRSFVGAVESDYTEGAIPGNRFATGVTAISVDTDLAKLPLSIDPQMYTGSPIEPLSGENGGIKVFNGYWLNTDKDFTVTYANNTNVGTATATLTAAEGSHWSGSVTLDFKISDYTLTIKSPTQDIFTFNKADLQKWAEEATDNTEPQYYQYTGANKAEVYYVPAKQYITLDTIASKVGASDWTAMITDSDGFTYTYTPEQAANGYFFPAMTADSNSTSGAQKVPAVLALQWMSSPLETTASVAAQEAAKNTPDTTPRNFVGITESDYASGSNMGGNRFVTNPDSLTIDATYKSSILKDNPSDAWYYEYVNSAMDLGLITGYMDGDQLTGYFGPNDGLTRAQAATILYRASGDAKATDSTENETPFTDVESGTWYTAAINWAYKEGVFNGYDGTNDDGSKTFGTNDYLTRAQTAVCLSNYAQKVMGEDVDNASYDTSLFTDWSAVPDWAQSQIKWAASHEIMTGVPGTDGKSALLPDNHTLRCEMAKMILETMESNR